MLGILCRISGDKEEGKDRSIFEQEELGKAQAKKLGLNYKLYKEINVSGTLPIEEREELDRLLFDVQEGTITAIFIWMQDRLERNPQTRFIIKEILKEKNCKLFTESGEVDLHDDALDMLGDLMSVYNAYFVKTTKKRVTRILKRNAEANRVHGIIPYGYRNTNGFYAINKDEEIIVKKIYNLSLSNVSTNKIADELNKDTTNRGKKWLGSSIQYLLKNPIYKGQRKFGGKKSVKTVTKNGKQKKMSFIKKGDENFVPIDSIIDPIKWEQTQINLTKNRAYSGQPQKHNYLLKGLIKCGKCRRNYFAIVGKKNYYYTCANKRVHNNRPLKPCPNSGINITRLDNFIWNKFFQKKDLIKLVKTHFEKKDLSTELDRIQNKIKELETELKDNIKKFNNTQDLAINGVYTYEELKPKVKANKAQRTTIEIALKNAKEELFLFEKSNNNSDDIINQIYNIKEETPFNDRKILVQKYVESIFVDIVNNHYHLQVKFNIPNMDVEHYGANKKFKYIFEAKTGGLEAVKRMASRLNRKKPRKKQLKK